MLNLLWFSISKIYSSHWFVSAHLCHIFWKCMVTKPDDGNIEDLNKDLMCAIFSGKWWFYLHLVQSVLLLFCVPQILPSVSKWWKVYYSSLFFIFLVRPIVSSFIFLFCLDGTEWELGLNFNFYSTFFISHFSFFIEFYSCFLNAILFWNLSENVSQKFFS